MRPNKLENVWAKINVCSSEECWPWTGTLVDGYGRMKMCQVPIGVHRIIYYLTHPEWSLDSPLHVLHTCDNRRCCNPRHLWLGTNLDNIVDKVNKGRQARQGGEEHSRLKLSWTKALEIRELEKQMSQRGIAKRYNVAQSTVWAILHKKIWWPVPVRPNNATA